MCRSKLPAEGGKFVRWQNSPVIGGTTTKGATSKYGEVDDKLPATGGVVEVGDKLPAGAKVVITPIERMNKVQPN